MKKISIKKIKRKKLKFSSNLWSVGESSAPAAAPRILSLASAYSFSRCSKVFGWGFEFCEAEDKAGDESGRFRIVTAGLGR